MDIKETLLQYFRETKKFKDIDENTDLFAGGYVNSMFALEMVLFLEKTFQIKIPKKLLSKANFTSVAKITALVEEIKK